MQTADMAHGRRIQAGHSEQSKGNMGVVDVGKGVDEVDVDGLGVVGFDMCIDSVDIFMDTVGGMDGVGACRVDDVYGVGCTGKGSVNVGSVDMGGVDVGVGTRAGGAGVVDNLYMSVSRASKHSSRAEQSMMP